MRSLSITSLAPLLVLVVMRIWPAPSSRGARIPPHPPKSSSRAPSYGRIPYSPRAPLVPAYTHPRPPPRMPPPSNENAQACMCSGRGARAIAMESPSPRRLHCPPFATAPLLLTASPLHPLCPLAASLAGEPPAHPLRPRPSTSRPRIPRHTCTDTSPIGALTFVRDLGRDQDVSLRRA
ncbi:hypothetical protein DFH09DRAFT_189846 [Mycena vulgaris]|nr:hypothetical protein DFH09DRAFT_189846 [Mycena vulgaris]